jgi:uncharacterized membrane protein
MSIIEESIEIKHPVDKVFAYTTDAGSWPKWQPFPEAEKTSQGPMNVGATTRGKIRMMGLTMGWTAIVTEYEQNKKFGKNIISGPITNEQHNTYNPIKDGTRFAILYNMKVGGLMKPLSPMIIRSMRKATKKALGNLKGILEAQT